jgi:hypothetical protein
MRTTCACVCTYICTYIMFEYVCMQVLKLTQIPSMNTTQCSVPEDSISQTPSLSYQSLSPILYIFYRIHYLRNLSYPTPYLYPLSEFPVSKGRISPPMGSSAKAPYASVGVPLEAECEHVEASLKSRMFRKPKFVLRRRRDVVTLQKRKYLCPYVTKT